MKKNISLIKLRQ